MRDKYSRRRWDRKQEREQRIQDEDASAAFSLCTTHVSFTTIYFICLSTIYTPTTRRSVTRKTSLFSIYRLLSGTGRSQRNIRNLGTITESTWTSCSQWLSLESVCPCTISQSTSRPTNPRIHTARHVTSRQHHFSQSFTYALTWKIVDT